jgi:hypothetical protein
MGFENDRISDGVRISRTPQRSTYEDKAFGVLLATVEPDEPGWLTRCYVSPDYVELIPSAERHDAEQEAASHAQVVSDALRRRAAASEEGGTP